MRGVKNTYPLLEDPELTELMEELASCFSYSPSHEQDAFIPSIELPEVSTSRCTTLSSIAPASENFIHFRGPLFYQIADMEDSELPDLTTVATAHRNVSLQIGRCKKTNARFAIMPRNLDRKEYRVIFDGSFMSAGVFDTAFVLFGNRQIIKENESMRFFIPVYRTSDLTGWLRLLKTECEIAGLDIGSIKLIVGLRGLDGLNVLQHFSFCKEFQIECVAVRRLDLLLDAIESGHDNSSALHHSSVLEHLIAQRASELGIPALLDLRGLDGLEQPAVDFQGFIVPRDLSHMLHRLEIDGSGGFTLPDIPGTVFLRDEIEKVLMMISSGINKCGAASSCPYDRQKLRLHIALLRRWCRGYALTREGKVLSLGFLKQALSDVLCSLEGYVAPGLAEVAAYITLEMISSSERMDVDYFADLTGRCDME